MAKGFCISILSMSHQSNFKLSTKIRNLFMIKKITPGFDVVKLPKVDPVGGMLGGYFDL